MTWWASTLQILRIALGGIYLYTAFFLLWAYWYRRRDPSHLALAAWCVVTASFFVCRHFGVQAQDPSSIHRLAWTSALLWIPAGLYVTWVVTRQALDRWRLAALAGALLLALGPHAGDIFLSGPSWITADQLGAAVMVAAPGPLAFLTGPALLASCVYIYIVARRAAAVGKARRGVAIFTIVAVLPAMGNDALLASGVLPSIFLGELAFLILVLVNMPLLVSWTTGSMHNLEAAVEDRTRQLHEQQAELARSLLNVTELIDGLPDTVLVHRDGTFRFVNAVGEAFLGYSAAELINRPLADLVLPRDRPKAAELFRKMEQRRPPSPPEELRFVRRDGETLFGEVVGLSFSFEGEPAAIAIIRDVSARRDLEAQVQLSDKLASVGQLTASIGHEITNPLTFLLANINLVNERLEGQPPRSDESFDELRALVGEAVDGAARVQEIVRDLRSFARADQDDEERKPVDVRDPLKVALAMARAQIKHRALLEARLEPVPLVLASGARLTQVFVNLLVNAIHAIPEDDRADAHRVTVTTRVGHDQMVVVEVVDTGSGIPEPIQRQVFEPFFTTKPVGVGTGLGLSLCRKIVASHGGEITLESDPGRGSTFTVRLPATQAKPAPASAPRPRRTTPRRAAVLIVDDEALVARSIGRMLAEHDVTIAQDGADALELCKQRSFDLILCDLVMPRMSGMELLEGFRALGQRIEERVVFMSGGRFPGDEQALAALPNKLLEKPIDPLKLNAILVDRVA